MNGVVFLLLFVICIGLIYIVHRYFGKHEFYLLTVIYSIISFMMSFKLITILGININMSITFSSGLIMMMYYFVNRYDNVEINKYIITIMMSVLSSIIIILLGSIMIPSIYDENLILFKDLFFDNLAIIILYPIALFITLILSSYSFKELKKVDKNRTAKTVLTLVGIIFVDVFVLIYFSYAFIIKFDDSILIAIGNYFVKIIVITIMYLLLNKIMRVKKVKS